MVFCRGCGKEIHESAPTCPHCGYVVKEVASNDRSKSVWLAVTSSIFPLPCFANWFSVAYWNKNTVVGLWMFIFVTSAMAIASINQKRGGKIFGYITLGVSGITFLMLLGKL